MKVLRSPAGAGLAVGFGLVVLAAIVGYDTASMRVPPTYAKVGPQVFPYLTAAALAALGVFFIQQALRGKQGAIRTEGHQTDWSALAVISAGLLSQPVLMESVGFVPSAILLFVLVAWGFGSRRLVRDLVIAVVLALAIHVGFTRLLNLQLPAGVLKGLL